MRFSKIVDQILSNAIKFSPTGKEINVSIIHDTNNVYISIQDNGQGISAYDQDFLFKKFIPLSARPTGGESSMGLGLSLAKQLVEMHRGDIHVSSVGEGHGSTFTNSVPIHQANMKAKTA